MSAQGSAEWPLQGGLPPPPDFTPAAASTAEALGFTGPAGSSSSGTGGGHSVLRCYRAAPFVFTRVFLYPRGLITLSRHSSGALQVTGFLRQLDAVAEHSGGSLLLVRGSSVWPGSTAEISAVAAAWAVPAQQLASYFVAALLQSLLPHCATARISAAPAKHSPLAGRRLRSAPLANQVGAAQLGRARRQRRRCRHCSAGLCLGAAPAGSGAPGWAGAPAPSSPLPLDTQPSCP